jgi:hypothetical protein
MSNTLPIQLLRTRYAEAAQAYLTKLRTERPENFMGPTTQARQRKITVKGLDLVSPRRPAVQVFNELLVRYTDRDSEEVRQVVQDSMIVLRPEPIEAENRRADAPEARLAEVMAELARRRAAGPDR